MWRFLCSVSRLDRLQNAQKASSIRAHSLLLCLSISASVSLPVYTSPPYRFTRCTKIINADSEDPKYIINVKQFAKFVVDLSDQVAPTDIEEGMRVGYVYTSEVLLSN